MTATPSDPLSAARARLRAAQVRHRAQPEMLRGLHAPYFRRGEMSIPAFKMEPGGDPEREGRAQSLKLLGKAAVLPVDFFFFDLEDAAPDHPDLKPLARRLVIEAFQTMDFGRRIAAFRPNNIRTAYFEDDVIDVVQAVGDRLHAMVLPKSETAQEVADVQALLRDLQRLAGRARPLAIEVLIESPRALLQAEAIASVEDVSALIFGAWDFARTVGGAVDAQRWLADQALARQMLPVVAAAHGKEAVDAVTATLPIRPKDPGDREAASRHAAALELARRDAQDARRLGYAAKWVLHPDQIEPIQGAFTPVLAEARAALTLAADYTRAALQGSGAQLVGNRLADKAVVGTDWWLVRSALAAGVLGPADIAATGYDLATLERTVRTR